MSAHDYSLFGLTVRSELPLPELFAAEPGATPDITIRLGEIPPPAESRAGLHEDDGALVLVVPDAGRYRIADGEAITVQPNAGAADRNVRLYLLGSAFGALLHQRGLLPLHANAVEVDGKAVAFMGESGAGKSTLAAWFHDHGHRVIADDVSVVRLDDEEGAFVLQGLPRLRLWQDALEQTGRRSNDYERSYAGAPTWNKFDVPIAVGGIAPAIGLAAIYVLERGAGFAVERLSGVAAAEALFAHTYRGSYVAATSDQRGHWAACVRLIRTVPVFRLTRLWELNSLHDTCAGIVDFVGGHRQGVASAATEDA